MIPTKKEKKSQGFSFWGSLLPVLLCCLLTTTAVLSAEALFREKPVFSITHNLSENIDLLALLMVVVLYGMYAARKPRFSVPLALLAGVFSLLNLLSCWMEKVKPVPPSLPRAVVIFLGYWLLYYCIMVLAASFIHEGAASPAVSRRRRTGVYFVLLLVFWLPMTILCFPGNVTWDSFSSLQYFLGVDRSNINNPIFQNLLMGSFYELGQRFGNPHGGIALYCTLQMLAYALVISTILEHIRSLTEKGWLISSILLVMLGVLPVFPIYALTMGKDSNLALMLLIFNYLLVRFTEDPAAFAKSPKHVAGLILSALAVSLLRNGSIIMVLPCVVICLFMCMKAVRRFPTGIAAATAVLVLAMGIFHAAVPASRSEISEGLSLPLQQTARFVITHPQEVTGQEKEALNAVIPYQAFESYVPGDADPVKNQFDDSASPKALMGYAKVWTAQFARHPGTYAKAFYHMSSGYYSPRLNITKSKPHVQLGYYSNSSIRETLGLPAHPSPWLETVKEWDKAVTNLPVIGIFQKIGIYSWALFFCLYMLLSRKKTGLGLPLLSSLILFFGCCLTPINGYHRYAFPMILSVLMICPCVLLRLRLHPDREEEAIPLDRPGKMRYSYRSGF